MNNQDNSLISDPKGKIFDVSLRILMALIGIFLLSIGTSFLLGGHVGTPPFTATNVGASNMLHIGLGNFQLAFNLIILVVVLFLDHSMIGIGTILNMVLVGYIIQYGNVWYQNTFATNHHMGLLLIIGDLVIGMLLFTFGASLYMCADLGVAPSDAIAPIASSRLHIKYKTARVIQDIAFMICALLVHGSVGVATFVIAFFAGPLINYWTIHVSRPVLHNIHLIAENKTKIRRLGSSLKQAGIISYKTVISWYRETLQTQLSASRYSNHELDEQLDIAKNNLLRAQKIYKSMQDEYDVLTQEKKRRLDATNEKQ